MSDTEWQPRRRRTTARWVLAALYLLVGLFHLCAPRIILPIMPGWVPFPLAVILGTGLCEIAGAIGLLTREFRRVAGAALALYAVCVFPANIHHAIISLRGLGWQLGWWYHGPRLAFQPVLVWWALYAGELIDWPFKRASVGAVDAHDHG